MIFLNSQEAHQPIKAFKQMINNLIMNSKWAMKYFLLRILWIVILLTSQQGRLNLNNQERLSSSLQSIKQTKGLNMSLLRKKGDHCMRNNRKSLHYHQLSNYLNSQADLLILKDYKS
jgi:hypothetical protein